MCLTTCLPTLGNHRIYSKVKLAVTLNRLIAESHNCNININIFYFRYLYLYENLLPLKPNIFQFRATVLQIRSLEEDDKYIFFLPLKKIVSI